MCDAGALEHRGAQEDIFTAAIANYEAKPLLTLYHFTVPISWTLAWGRSGARHTRAAARGSAPLIPYAARRALAMPGRDGKAG